MKPCPESDLLQAVIEQAVNDIKKCNAVHDYKCAQRIKEQLLENDLILLCFGKETIKYILERV